MVSAGVGQQAGCRDEEHPTSHERAVPERAPISIGRGHSDGEVPPRGWKLFLLLPRMLLHKQPRGGLTSIEKLGARFQLFAQGQWAELALEGAELTPGTNVTLQMLSDHSKRPPEIREPLPAEV